ncbi:3003_t:CDS:2, partial [Racocetra fulgida]
MTRETKLKKYTRKFRSEKGDIAQVTNQYLEDTSKLLGRKLRRREISQEEYEIRIKEIEQIKNAINDLQIQIKNLQDELNSLKDENRKLRQENSELHDSLNGLCNNFNNDKQIQVKNQEVINLHRIIRKILEDYNQKYKRDSTGSSKITDFIKTEITEKKKWKDIETSEILAEIVFQLDLNSLLAFSLENDPKKNLFMAIHSVDSYQLVGYYMNPSIRHSNFSSHLLFFLRKDVDTALSEYNMLPENLRSEWIEKKSNFVQEYQTEILKMKHPNITDENIQNILGNAPFYFQNNFNLQDYL